jgi:taurine dioxygenase
MRQEPLVSGFGAALADLDLSDELSASEAEHLRECWSAHHLLVIKNQQLQPGDQIRCLEYLGTVIDEADDRLGYRVSTNTRSNNRGLAELVWHADYGSTPYPLGGISLYANEISGALSGTAFVSGAQAYARLDPARRQQMDALTVVQVVTPSGEPLDPAGFDDEWTRLSDPTTDRVVSRLPAVIVHPATGERILNVCQMFSLGFDGVSYKSGRDLMDELFSVLYDSNAIYSHEWESGDLVIWDNIAMQHRRAAVPSPALSGGAVRTMTRVAISDTYAELRQYLPGIKFALASIRDPTSLSGTATDLTG